MGIALITNNILSDSGTAVSGLVPTSRTISTTAPLTGGGDLSADRTFAIPAATSTISGYLTNVDWVTFNSKQNALVNPVTGTGTTNYIPKFTGSSTIGNSAVTDDGTNVTLLSRKLVGSTVELTTSTLTDALLINNGAGRGIRVNNAGSGYGVIINNDTAATAIPFLIQKSGVDKISFTDAGAATFSSTVLASGVLQVGGTINQFYAGASKTSLYVDASRYVMSTIAGYGIAFEIGVTPVLSLAASTGAATFSSTITTANNAGSSINITTNGNNGTSASPLQTNVNFYGYAGNLNGQIRVDDIAGTAQVGTMKFYTWNSAQVLALTLSQTGAAAFANNITAGGYIYTNGNLGAANGNQSANSVSATLYLGNRGYFTSPDTGAAQISAVSTGANWYSGTALAFYTNPGPDVTGTSAVERMRIRSTGAVSIGAVSGTSGILDIKPGAATSDGATLSATYTGTGSYGPFIFQTSDTERMRINADGRIQAFVNGVNGQFQLHQTNSGYNTDAMMYLFNNRNATSSYTFAKFFSGYPDNTQDIEFNFRGDGVGLSDGGWTSPASDYAEYFESSNGQSLPIGSSVVLENGKIRLATQSDTNIIGVIRPKNAALFLGNNADSKWNQKYIKDDFGAYVLDSEGMRTLNPAYDSSYEYIPREKRSEWNIVGLVGQIPVLKDSPKNSNWVKMSDISSTVEMWLVK